MWCLLWPCNYHLKEQWNFTKSLQYNWCRLFYFLNMASYLHAQISSYFRDNIQSNKNEQIQSTVIGDLSWRAAKSLAELSFSTSRQKGTKAEIIWLIILTKLIRDGVMVSSLHGTAYLANLHWISDEAKWPLKIYTALMSRTSLDQM